MAGRKCTHLVVHLNLGTMCRVAARAYVCIGRRAWDRSQCIRSEQQQNVERAARVLSWGRLGDQGGSSGEVLSRIDQGCRRIFLQVMCYPSYYSILQYRIG